MGEGLRFDAAHHLATVVIVFDEISFQEGLGLGLGPGLGLELGLSPSIKGSTKTWQSRPLPGRFATSMRVRVRVMLGLCLDFWVVYNGRDRPPEYPNISLLVPESRLADRLD